MPKTIQKIKKKPEAKKTSKKTVKPKKEKRAKTKIKKVEEPALEKEKPDRYWAGVGRRKTSVARARIFAKGEKDFLVNYKPYQNYFPTLDCWQIASASLNKMKALDKLRVLVEV